MSNIILTRPLLDRKPISRGHFSPTRSESALQCARYKMESFFPLWHPKGDPTSSGDYRDWSGDPYTDTWRRRWLPLNGNTYDSLRGNYGIRYAGPNQSQSNGATSGVAVPANRSIMCCFTIKTPPGSNLFRQVWGIGGGGAWLCDFGFDDRGFGLFYEVTGGAVSLFTASGVITKNTTHGVVCVSNNSVGMKIFVNGMLAASNGSTGFLTLGNTTVAANIASNPFVGSGHDFVLHTSAYWPRALSDLEAQAISCNPFGLMRTSDRMYGFTDVIAGGGGGGARSFATFI